MMCRSAHGLTTGPTSHRYNGVVRRLWQWWWSRNPYLVDGIITAVIVITSVGAMFHTNPDADRFNRHGDAIGTLLVLVTAVPLVWRRQAPTRVLAIVLAGYSVHFLLAYSEGSLGMAAMIAIWTVVTRAPLPSLWPIAAVGVPLIPLSWIASSEPSLVGNAVSQAVFFAGAAIAGHNVRLRREKRAQEELTEQAETERAVSDERLRIARELHDVVAHAMSIVAVQAGVAAHVIDDQPDEAKRMLENVRATSSQALDEMRRLLGVLRGGDAALAPAPGLHDVDTLAASMRSSGVPVELRVSGERHDVPGGVELTAYRIVQEALTNVLKHAGPNVTAAVTVTYDPNLVTVEIVDDGRGAAVNPSGGHGLLGMRERVAVFGGDLVAGPKPGGGFRVRAELPYGER
jgi:signal transduction histidine kinase